MTEAEWKKLWGNLSVFNASFGIPSLWRQLHEQGKPLGPAFSNELPTAEGAVIQYFAGGAITWGGPKAGPVWWSTAGPGPRTDTAPRNAVQLRPAPGYRPFYHDCTVVWDAQGVLWWNAQCQDGKGQVVFRQAAGGTTAWESGKDGRGALRIVAGWLYVSVGAGTGNDRAGFVLPVPGWTST